MNIAIVDYGVGNLFSLKCSFAAIGEQAEVTGDPARILSADRLVLPGVGAFGDAAERLRSAGLDSVLKEAAAGGIPLLGICLGMQLLFDESWEYGVHAGLGLVPGCVRPISDVIPAGQKIPHMGWNALKFRQGGGDLFRSTPEGAYVYFVHSYYAAECGPYITAETEYGAMLTAAVQRGSVYGCQFHPEKSGKAGLNILREFVKGAGTC